MVAEVLIERLEVDPVLSSGNSEHRDDRLGRLQEARDLATVARSQRSARGSALRNSEDASTGRRLPSHAAELLEFAEDPRGAPIVFSDHLANEGMDLGVD